MQEIYIFEDSQQSKIGGGQKVTGTLIDYLASRKDIYFCICDTLRREDSFFKRWQEGGFYAYSRPQLSPTVTGPSFTFNFGQSLRLVTAAFFAGLKIVKIIKSRIKSNTPIFYCPTKYGYLVALLPAVIFKIKIIMHVHNIADNTILSRFFQWLLRKTVAKVVCVSQSVFDSVDHPHKTLLRNPIPERSLTQRSCRISELSVGVIASFFAYKGHNFFLEEAAKLVSGYPYLNVHLYGDGPERAALLQRYGCEAIQFHGRLNDLDDMYLHLDVVVIPSLQAEAFSLVIPEAWSYGCLVLASDVPAHRELIEDGVNGLLFKAGNSKDLFDKLDSLVKDRHGHSELIKGGYASLTQLKISDYAARLLQIIL
jgi:glycosyltransferase involved in cell wall biosynthesis